MLKQFEVQNIYIGEYVKPDYLCFTANTAGSTIKLNKVNYPTEVTLETSTDWDTWSTHTIGSTITLTNIWDKIYFRNASETDTRFNLRSNQRYYFEMTWSIDWSWDVNFLLNKNSTTTLSQSCYTYLFYNCSALKTPPRLPATTLAEDCYDCMFAYSWITKLIELPVTTIPAVAYYAMFTWCSSIKLSAVQSWVYQTPYRIPKTWTWTAGSSALAYMFDSTWWSFTGTPSINTTYYTSNEVIS